MAELLKQQGYATMCVGKWHLGDQPEFLPTRHGFDHYVGLPYSNDMGGSGKQGDRRPPVPLLRDQRVVEAPVQQDKLVELYTEEAVKFITANKDRPFFLYLPHTAVHVPIHPGKAFQGKSANGRYGDWVEEVDWSTGRVLDTLRKLKLDSRTLVLFTSDNGPWRSQGKDGGVAGPLRGGKASTWEGGVREPTIAWWPGRIPAGTACDAMMSEMDVLPTLVKLAGGEVPGDRVIDGKDIWPLLSGRSKQSPHEALFYFKGNRLEAVRSGPWKLAIVGADRRRHRQGEEAFGRTLHAEALQPGRGHRRDDRRSRRAPGRGEAAPGLHPTDGRGFGRDRPGARRACQRRGRSAAAVVAAKRHGVRLRSRPRGRYGPRGPRH